MNPAPHARSEVKQSDMKHGEVIPKQFIRIGLSQRLRVGANMRIQASTRPRANMRTRASIRSQAIHLQY